MPRIARLKSCDSVYHIMVRSISEVILFKEDCDKDKYLKLMEKYQDLFLFKVYAYCLMDNHAHFIIYANGADISKIMHGINHSYAQYYNYKYGRHGHLFQDRFKSKIIYDDRSLIVRSIYIHKNAEDIPGYKHAAEKYQYSSLGIYLGKMKDRYNLVDYKFILEMFNKDIVKARKQYMSHVDKCDEDNVVDITFSYEGTEYRSQRVLLLRNYKIDDILKFVSQKTGMRVSGVRMKHNRQTIETRALSVLFLRSLCNLKFKDICSIVGNISQARLSKLCSIGLEKVLKEDKYRGIVEEFIEKQKTA